MIKKIKLTQGKYTLVDEKDYKLVSKYKWCAHFNGRHWYAVTNTKGKNRTILYMHRLILNAPKGKDVDHVNHDTLNNCRCNIRVCSRSQNNANAKIRINKKSKYKGVTKPATCLGYYARIAYKGKQIWLGYFRSEIDAAKAYNDAARKIFGKFARLNNVA